jgi:hypothetical protein
MREVPKFVNPEMLREIRDHADWRRVFEALGLQRTRGGNENDWWAHSPFSEDRHPSFHIGERGWYCWSTGQGGGVIELVQKVMGNRLGKEMNCYEAGRWLVENGLSYVDEPAAVVAHGGTVAGMQAPNRDGQKEKEEGGEGNAGTAGVKTEVAPRENRPIRQSLVPALDMGYEEFARRGISRETCAYLGCGYLPENSKSPLRGRIVFQVRSVREEAEGEFKPVILTHIGRAVTREEEENWGKWRAYEGFQKSLELYNIDQLLLDEEALRQAKETGRVLVVEGCFDVAKLVEADIRNVVATFGSRLLAEQLPRLDLIAEKTGVQGFLLVYDRDRAGNEGMEKALELIRTEREGLYDAEAFDWERSFPSPARGAVKIPGDITDACEFSVEQLKWLRSKTLL